MWKRLIVDYEKCTGCRLCEMGCSLKNFGVMNPELSKIKVYGFFPGIDIPMFCSKCSDAPCIDSCQYQALSKTEDGCIKVEIDLCTGCGNCIRNCRSQIINLHPKEKYPLICDHCGGGEPECVKSCPTQALDYKPLPFDGKYNAKVREEIYSELRKKLYPNRTCYTESDLYSESEGRVFD